MVYVLNKNGFPLMPTERHGKVRRMLRDGKAHVVRLEPFTIQLDYSSGETIQDVSLGIDAGSKHIGVSATTEKQELLSMQVEERDDIVELIATRRESRRTRRSRKLRYRPSRFDNRRRKEGWLTPSSENRVVAHLRIIRLVHSILPIAKITIEVAQFDSQKIMIRLLVLNTNKVNNLVSGMFANMCLRGTDTFANTARGKVKTKF